MRSFFFFSSRRRHTRSLCGWSSDVCSSDLRANISLRTVSNIENGRPMTRMGPSVTKIEVALDWEPGSFQRVLAGQQPVVRSTAESPMRYVSSSHIRASLDGDLGEVDLSSVS